MRRVERTGFEGPPELYGKKLSQEERNKSQDSYGANTYKEDIIGSRFQRTPKILKHTKKAGFEGLQVYLYMHKESSRRQFSKDSKTHPKKVIRMQVSKDS